MEYAREEAPWSILVSTRFIDVGVELNEFWVTQHSQKPNGICTGKCTLVNSGLHEVHIGRGGIVRFGTFSNKKGIKGGQDQLPIYPTPFSNLPGPHTYMHPRTICPLLLEVSEHEIIQHDKGMVKQAQRQTYLYERWAFHLYMSLSPFPIYSICFIKFINILLQARCFLKALQQFVQVSLF